MKMHDDFTKLQHALSLQTSDSSDFDLNPDVILPEGRKLRKAGVLVPFIEIDGAVYLILTKRASALKHHPGQIAFPGGKQDDSDTDITATALREASEEIGLFPKNVSVLGILPHHETVTGFSVTPVIGRVMSPFAFRPEPGEVDEVFYVPFKHVMTRSSYFVESRRWRGQRRYYFTVPYGPYYIWGATARILCGIADRMAS